MSAMQIFIRDGQTCAGTESQVLKYKIDQINAEIAQDKGTYAVKSKLLSDSMKQLQAEVD